MKSNKNTSGNIFKFMAILLVALMFSCEGFHEVIVPVDVKVENVGKILVINGYIEQNATALVQISYSTDIDELSTVPKEYEQNAKVSISSGTDQNENLSYFKDGWYYGSVMKGEVNKTYTMTIVIGTNTYTATSTMLPPTSYVSAWVVENGGKVSTGKTTSTVGYSDEWIIVDPVDKRNRYLFEWWRNGVHEVRRDWCIDDNRVVNVGGTLRLFNVTTDPGPNEHTRHRTAEVDKLTYDYYNMYEKIVRGIVSVASQTPYNPVSNFGKGTIGNFRAVAFGSAVILTPPAITVAGQNGQVVIAFPKNSLFTKYNLYWGTKAGITKTSNVISNLKYTTSKDGLAVYAHTNLTNGSGYYYRLEVGDAEGNLSVLSPEVTTKPDPAVPADINTLPTGKGPENVKAIPGSKSGEIVISWDAYTGADGYVIYWNTKGGVTSSSDIILGPSKGKLTSPYTHSGLIKGQTYYYRVAAYNSKDVFLSNEVSATAN